jgi:hypothetical protein
METMGRGLRRMASLLVLLAALGLAASSTHAPHLPELLGGMHPPQLPGHSSMEPARGAAAPHLAAADTVMHEVCCAVVGLTPTTAQLLFLQLAATVLLACAFGARRAWSPASRTKPPPLAGARLRATLQVFRN